jgi:L-seryl-tRNA(Ser) seleniumtransferase
MSEELYRKIPSIDRLLESKPLKKALGRYPRKLVVESMRETALSWRKRVRSGRAVELDLTREKFIAEALSLAGERLMGPLVKVINCTGIILNTNLGRAPLASHALAGVHETSGGYCNLEFDLEKGERGERHVHAELAIRELTGAGSALVVNNNAAAVLLLLDTFARKREVIVSRGELIEIGGSFRLPDVLKKSGARLVEVGTTNRTYVSDYERAITDRTSILLKSHTSNYRVIGFTHRPEGKELVKLARKYRLLCVEDLGSGLLVDLSRYGADEPTVGQVVKSGMDLVTYSGDKLLGGPQCGIILGKPKLVAQLKANPLMRALRVDKMTLSALSATLSLYLYSDDPVKAVPHLSMIAEPHTAIRRRALRVKRELGSSPGLQVSVVSSRAAVGGGSCPGLEIPSWALRMKLKRHSAESFARLLRRQKPPVIGTVHEDAVNLDLRSVLPDETGILLRVLKSLGRD